MKIGEIVKTKTFWGGLGLIAIGAARCFGGDLVGGLESIVGGLTAIFVRDAITKIGA